MEKEAMLVLRYSSDRFQCSLCDARKDDGIFSSSWTPERLVQDFREHVERFHAESIHKKKPREDVNQAAARVIREATERE
jgi:hypothetical protein